MSDKARKPAIKINLTPEQKEQIKQATGLEMSQLELSPEELEERVAPGSILLTCKFKCGSS